MTIEHPEQTTCPEDIPEGRAAEPLALDLSQPEEPAPFAAAIDAAANIHTEALTPGDILAAANRVQRKLGTQAKELMAAEIAADPRLAPYQVALKAAPYRKAPPPLRNEPETIVRNWLDNPKMLARHGSDIVASLQERYPGHVRADYMSSSLPEWQRKRLSGLLASGGVKATGQDCRSLSSIKTRLQDHHSAPEYDIFKPVVKIAKDGSHVFWNGKRYTVFLNSGAPTIKRDGKRIALSTLKKVLGA